MVLSPASRQYPRLDQAFIYASRRIDFNVIEAAVAESKKASSVFRHFVYSLVLNSSINLLMNHDRKKYVEENLVDSGLNWTILQPPHFMDPTLQALWGQRDKDALTFLARFDPSKKFTWLTLDDLAAVSLRITEEQEEPYYASYPLTSTKATTYIEFVETVGKILEKKVVI